MLLKKKKKNTHTEELFWISLSFLWTHSSAISCSTNIHAAAGPFIYQHSNASMQFNSPHSIWVQRFLAWLSFLRHKSLQAPMNQIPERTEQMTCPSGSEKRGKKAGRFMEHLGPRGRSDRQEGRKLALGILLSSASYLQDSGSNKFPLKGAAWQTEPSRGATQSLAPSWPRAHEGTIKANPPFLSDVRPQPGAEEFAFDLTRDFVRT